MEKLEIIKFALELLMQLVLIIVPIVIAFIQKDKSKWEKVVAAVPAAVELVDRTLKELPGDDKKKAALAQIEAATNVRMRGRSLNLADLAIEGRVAKLRRSEAGPA